MFLFYLVEDKHTTNLNCSPPFSIEEHVALKEVTEAEQLEALKIPEELEETALEIIGPELVETSIDNRMLDPDAMIESLDRFTAELVSQASHLQNKDEIKYTASVTEGSTWNEDTSPNDVTFPSISGSAPNVITFESEEGTNGTSEEIADIIDAPEKERISNDFSSINTTSTMTDSTLIAMEATKIMNAIRIEDTSHVAQQKKGGRHVEI